MILCCGEALIDMIPAPTVAGGEGFVPYPGGAVFNTAIALGRLGAPVGLLTGLSTDMFGQQLAAALRASHVDASAAVYSDRPTTLAFVKLENGAATYSFYDENSAGRMLTPRDMPALPPEVSALYFGGISLACEPGANAYAKLLQTEDRGRAVMIDPNIRPDFITNATVYRTRLNDLLLQADIVKVSDEDLDWLIPQTLSIKEKVSALLAKGPTALILTRGEKGATGYLAKGPEIHVPSVRAAVVDTVGAGDTFNAGVMASLFATGHLTKAGISNLSGNIFRRAIEHGARVAAVTVSRAGANPPWASEIDSQPAGERANELKPT